MTEQAPPADSGLDNALTAARAMLALDRELLAAPPPRHSALEARKLTELAGRATALATTLNQDVARFARLETQLQDARFVQRLLELPLHLADAEQMEPALTVARAFAFIAPDTLHGDEALILAKAGRREEALSRLSRNLEQAKDIPTAEAKAGDTYRALGEDDSAQAYYERSLAESKTAIERSEAILRLVSLFSDLGREKEAAALLEREQARLASSQESRAPRKDSKPGRNDPCPCGSGKKYKKCHGL